MTTDISTTKGPRYIEAIGRRKSAIARVRITENKGGKGSFVINGKTMNDYFSIRSLQVILEEALSKVKGAHKFTVTANVSGGGIHAQAEALRHGLSRALVTFEPSWRERLKKAGFLKRDSRAKERRKFGLKKARKAPQWSKR